MTSFAEGLNLSCRLQARPHGAFYEALELVGRVLAGEMEVAFAHAFDAAEAGVLADIVLRPRAQEMRIAVAVVHPGEAGPSRPGARDAGQDRLELRQRVVHERG